MMKSTIMATIGAAALALLGPGSGSSSAGEREASQLGSVLKRAQQMRDIQMTDDEETKLGEAVSERIRQRYGVVQDPAIHKYVTLVGGVLAQASTRPGLQWRFVVLDTDGVNALAAPGGLVHITRGALSLIKSEAELAGVLGHEIIHVTEKHTIKAIQKGKMVQMGADETVGSAGVFNKLVDKATGVVMAGFGREEELEADRKGIVIANTVGYNPNGLKDFLTTLAERNKASTEKQGLFASHPEMKERFVKLDDTVKTSKLAGTATVEARYKNRSPTPRSPSPRLPPSSRARRALPAAAPRRQTTRRRPATKAMAKPRSRRRSGGSVSAG